MTPGASLYRIGIALMHVKMDIECTGIQVSEDRERRKSLRMQAQRPRIDADTDPIVAVPREGGCIPGRGP